MESRSIPCSCCNLALKFGHWFGMDPQFWLNLQAQYDLALAEQTVGEKIRALPTAAGAG